MKMFLVMMLLSSVLAWERGFGNSSAFWSVPVYGKSYSTFIYRRHGTFMRKYQILSWEQLQFRRDAISKAITDLQKAISSTETDYLVSYGDKVSDVRTLLLIIMEHTAAIHSGLPRTGPDMSLDEYARSIFIVPGGQARGHANDSPAFLTFSKLESSYVPEKTWELYTEWGLEVKMELESVLHSVDEKKLTQPDKKKFFSLFDGEFVVEGNRRVYSSSGSDYVLKKDIPILSASGDLSAIYRSRSPSKHSLFEDIKLPDVVKEELEQRL